MPNLFNFRKTIIKPSKEHFNESLIFGINVTRLNYRYPALPAQIITKSLNSIIIELTLPKNVSTGFGKLQLSEIKTHSRSEKMFNSTRLLASKGPGAAKTKSINVEEVAVVTLVGLAPFNKEKSYFLKICRSRTESAVICKILTLKFPQTRMLENFLLFKTDINFNNNLSSAEEKGFKICIILWIGRVIEHILRA
jgi:hypothetical protein